MINTKSFDINHRILEFRGDNVDIYFTSSLCNEDRIAYMIEGITNARGKTLKDCLHNGDVKVPNDEQQEEYAMLTGCALVKHKGVTYVVDTHQPPVRSIEEPETEKSVRGSKDGFNESMLTSVGLIRRRIRTMDFVLDAHTIGTTNQLDICVCYLESKVKKELLDKVMARIKEVQTNDLIMTDRALEEIILDQGYNPFPLVRYSERPDVVATHIMHGYIVIICDNSSSAMMLPTTLFEILEHVEEHRQTPLIGTCIRILRFVAVFLSVYLVPIWVVYILQTTNIDSSFIWQVIAVELAIELLRIATIHTPTSLSNAMGVIAAVLLGQFAIDLGFFSEEVLLFCALGGVCGFATPNYELSLTNKYVKVMMIFSTFVFGIYGLAIFNILLIGYLASIKPFGYHYLYPLFPLNIRDLFDFLVRRPKDRKKNL